ncbi:unnamed protein product [Effrenium voratum]|nr:unnamed protein product [Effrenium voratum]
MVADETLFTKDGKRDPNASMLRTILHLSGSTFPRVVARSELWFLCGVNLTTWGAYQHGWLNADDYARSIIDVDWVDMKMLTMVSSFLLCFYAFQCFARYQHIFDLISKMLGSAHDVAFQARLFLPDATARRVCSRLVALSAVLAMAQCCGGPSLKGWRKLAACGLVKPGEAEALARSRQRCLVLLQRAGSCAQASMKANEKALAGMMGRILSMKEHQQELLSTARMSLPFNYNHLLTVVVMVTLLLLSYGAALTSSALAPGVFILTAFLFLGIMEAAHSLWDPFQDGVPHRWTQDFLLAMHALVDYEHDGFQDQWQAELREELGESRRGRWLGGWIERSCWLV